MWPHEVPHGHEPTGEQTERIDTVGRDLNHRVTTLLPSSSSRCRPPSHLFSSAMQHQLRCEATCSDIAWNHRTGRRGGFGSSRRGRPHASQSTGDVGEGLAFQVCTVD